MRNFITFPGVIIISFLIFASAANLYLSSPDNVCETDPTVVATLVAKRNIRESELTRPSIYENKNEKIKISLWMSRYTTWDNMISYGIWDVGGWEENGKICYWPTRIFFIERIPQRSREVIMDELLAEKYPHLRVLSKILVKLLNILMNQ